MDFLDDNAGFAAGISGCDAAYDGELNDLPSVSPPSTSPHSFRDRAKQTNVSAIDTGYGTWLDDGLRLVGAPAFACLRAVISSIDGSKELKPSRKDHRANFERRIECILANVIRTRFYRKSDRIAYATGNNAYLQKNSAYDSRWFSAASLRRDIARLEEVGMIERSAGEWDSAGWGSGRAATFTARPLLHKLMEIYPVHARSITKDVPPLKSLIQLRGEKGPNGQAPEVQFEWTEEIATWAARLDAYNQFVDQHDTWLEGLTSTAESRLLIRQNEKASAHSLQPGLLRVEDFNRFLKRVFNDGTFAHGGRLYGAWYQHAPSWLRQRMRIDDQSTVELDYSGMSVRMLYHQAGIDYLDDPYAIIELEQFAMGQGLRRDHYRESVKSLVQALLNGIEDDQPEMVKVATPFPRVFTRARVRNLILAKHEGIESAFGSAAGKRLQRLDSDIAFEIITGLMDQGIVCLPVHDSFIVIDRYEDKLRELMIQAYRKRLGYQPIIK